jgi:hypothetical protein
MRRVLVLAAVTCLCAIALQAETSVYRSYAKDKSAALRCRNASTLDRYNESLKEAGWGRFQEANPSVNFESHNAVIIAPQTFRSRNQIEITSIDQDGDRLIVRWNWRAYALTPTETSGGSSVSQSSTYEGPEVVVVTVPKQSLAGKTLSCAGPRV